MDFDTIGNYIIFYTHAFKADTMYLHGFFVDSFLNTSKNSTVRCCVLVTIEPHI